MHYIVIVTISLLLCTNASAQNCCTQNNSAEQDHAEQVVTLFQQQLKKELIQGLMNSPIDAISVCQIRAPQIAAKLSTDGVTVGRASNKPRNDKAVTPQWVLPYLEKYRHLSQENAVPMHVEIDSTRIGYVKPIRIQTPCLTCHGDHIDKPLQQKINQLYPNDQAVNYKKGEFRGVFWVETQL